jgi:hypothetical protein
MKVNGRKKGRFRVGDWVTFPFGVGDLTAQVIEERGPLGVGGRHIYRILVADEPEPDSFEIPEDHMRAAAVPDNAAIVRYLKEGGLVEILRSNLRGGPEQPRVWLTYRPRGQLTHTLQEERGVVGGATVPFFALHEDRIFKGKVEQVARYLESFGLERDEVEEIIAAVGMAP